MSLELFHRSTNSSTPAASVATPAPGGPALDAVPARFRYRALTEEEISMVEVR